MLVVGYTRDLPLGAKVVGTGFLFRIGRLANQNAGSSNAL